jgi:isocitrate dehydrogenase kinase/phosphatase
MLQHFAYFTFTILQNNKVMALLYQSIGIKKPGRLERYRDGLALSVLKSINHGKDSRKKILNLFF